MPISSGAIDFRNAFQVNPIILTGGLTIGLGGAAALFAIGGYSTGLVNSSQLLDPEQIAFYPLPGSTLISQEVAQYPFANQAIAANATIAKPLNVSLMMVYPATSYSLKQSILASLQATLSQHNSLGGLYNVFTPAFVYTNCILTGLRDVSGGDDKQKQYMYQWDFDRPLVTLQSAQAAQASLSNRLNNLTQGSAPVVVPSVSNALTATGNPNAVSQVQTSLTSGLTTALQTAGVPTSGLSNFVQTSLSGALSANSSITDLAGKLTTGLLPACGAAGLPIAMLQGIITTEVNGAFGSVGVSLASLTNLGVQSLQSAPIPAALAINSPFTAVFQ